jgi:hypothetical protein
MAAFFFSHASPVAGRSPAAPHEAMIRHDPALASGAT